MSARTPFVCGNWKMNGTVDEAAALAAGVRRLTGSLRGVEVGVAPPTMALTAVAKRLEGSNVRLAAQAVHPADSGAYTGEVSTAMLASAGCTHALVGHSERRQYNGIDDAAAAARVAALLEGGLTPLLCVGERLDEREAGSALKVVGRQVRAGLAPVGPNQVDRVVLAYEPVWAIGTGKTATPAQAQEVHAFIRGLLKEVLGVEAAAGTRILYGGSVKPANAAELMGQPDIDGALVGGASLNDESFAAIVRAARPSR